MVSVVDSVSSFGLSNFRVSDTLIGAERTYISSDIFGASSRVDLDFLSTISSDSISWTGSIIIVVLLSLYCYILFRYHNAIRVSFKSILSIEDTLFIFENLTLDFARFLALTRILLAFSLSIFISMGGGDWQNLLCLGVVGVLTWLFLSLSSVGRHILSSFDYNLGRWAHIGSITALNQAVISIILPPIVIICCSLSDNFLVISIFVFGSILYHFLRLLRYFRLSGFSILQWILYLCAVEVLPFTLLVGIARWKSFLI